LDEGLGFAIRVGGRTVGAGVVTKILKYSTVNRQRSTVDRWPSTASESEQRCPEIK
jgi:hypothetical protein